MYAFIHLIAAKQYLLFVPYAKLSLAFIKNILSIYFTSSSSTNTITVQQPRLLVTRLYTALRAHSNQIHVHGKELDSHIQRLHCEIKKEQRGNHYF